MTIFSIPDAPWIQNAEKYGTEYTSNWWGFDAIEEDDDEDECDDDDEETDGFMKYRDRLVKFEQEKRRLPKNLTPQEYEERVKKLAKRWRI